MLVLVVVSLTATRLAKSEPLANTALFTFWIAFAWMLVQYRGAVHYAETRPVDPDRPILCIGDSLTQGMIPDPGFPGALRSLVSVAVINRGVSGISTTPAIGLLQRSLELNPQLVILELGGHDFLKGHRRSVAKDNLRRMISMCHASDARVILMEIPRGFMVDPYFSLERELAFEMGAELLDDRWLRHTVLMSPIAPPGRWLDAKQHLSDDGIHSNPKGSRVIANKVLQSITNVLGPAASKSDTR